LLKTKTCLISVKDPVGQQTCKCNRLNAKLRFGHIDPQQTKAQNCARNFAMGIKLVRATNRSQRVALCWVSDPRGIRQAQASLHSTKFYNARFALFTAYAETNWSSLRY